MPTVYLSITINSLTGEVQALAYEKAFLKDFLDTQARELHLPTLEPVFKKARQQIKAAKDSVELQGMMLTFSKACYDWKGEWLERGAKDKVKELSWQADKLALTLVNMPIYGDYGINLHHTQPIAPTLKPFETFAAGLPRSFIDAVYKQPRFAIAYTSGSYLNNYGHALLFCGEAGFIHINAPISLPRYMSINQFNRYLKEEKKILLGMMSAHITQVNALLVALHKMSQQTWTWLAVLHNCLTFTHDVLKAGGYNVEKQEEFRKHILKLPTEHLKSTRERDLILTQQVSIPFHHFDPHVLATHLLVNLPILQNFHPDAIEKLIMHLLEHPIAVLKQQAELLAAQDNRPAHEGHIAQARSEILATLEKLAKGLTADYNIIFTDQAQLKRVLENIARVDAVLKNSLSRAIIQTKVSHIQSTLFAQAPISFALDSKPTLLMSM